MSPSSTFALLSDLNATLKLRRLFNERSVELVCSLSHCSGSTINDQLGRSTVCEIPAGL